MATDISNGLKTIDNGDRGNTFNSAINNNFVQLSTHNHDGVNSDPLALTAIAKQVVTIVAAGWVAENNQYKQLVTLPTGLAFDDVNLDIRLNSGSQAGAVIYPTILKTASNQFELFLNDNTLDVKVIIS